jgi:hypothetical protein
MTPARLLDLLPGWIRAKDASPQGTGDLARLLEVLAEALTDLEVDVRRLADRPFVERAPAEDLPGLAELLGVPVLGLDVATTRALLAHAVEWRRRKGTVAVLEDAVAGTTGWSTEVEEGHLSLGWVQDLHAPLLSRGRTAALWDPLALADPLSRRPVRPRHGSPQPVLGPLVGESTTATLRRLGRADALQPATSPRLIDLRRWPRPESVLVRTDRFLPVEREGIAQPRVASRGDGAQLVRLDPLDRDGPMVWWEPIRGAPAPTTAVHEPVADASEPRFAARVLTPTALALDPDAVLASGAFDLRIDGVKLLGAPEPVEGAVGPARSRAIPASGTLRLADPARVPTGDVWQFELLATATNDDVLATLTVPGESVRAVDAGVERGAATARVRVRRLAGSRWRWGVGGWGDPGLTEAPGLQASNAVSWNDSRVLRVEHAPGGGHRFVGFDPAGPAAGWTVADLGATLGGTSAGARFMLASAGGALVAVGTDGEGRLAAWSVADPLGAPVVTRLDTPPPGRPGPARRDNPAIAVHDGRVWVFGGRDGAQVLGDLWSVPLAGGAWEIRLVRRAPSRFGASLLASGTSLYLLGGAELEGALALEVRQADLSVARPTWRLLPGLPGLPGKAGQVGAALWPAGGPATAIEAWLWADRTRGTRWTLPLGADSWSEEPAAGMDAGPTPPGDGDLVSFGGEWWVVAAPPLPPADLVVPGVGGARLHQLPPVDIPVGAAAVLELLCDGGARHLDEVPVRGPYGDRDRRAGDGGRYAVPGRLDRTPYTFRQLHLGTWPAGPVAPAVDVVGLDPRTGRVFLPPGAPRGVFSTSVLQGRTALIGAGCLPVAADIPAAWGVAPPPPAASGAAPTAWASPQLAGAVLRRGGVAAVVVASPDLPFPASGAAFIGIPGSARFPATRVHLPPGREWSLWATDSGASPVFDRGGPSEPALELIVVGDAGGGPTPTTPTRWLGGLWIDGRLELALAAGAVDLRWCTVGRPGEVSIRVPGSGAEGATLRRSVPGPEIELRLHGCEVGVVELPPWVRLVAAGCTFDAGDDAGVAIRAAGAQVVLRHCTVRGGVEAGVVEASSCVVTGAVDADRPDLGWLRWSVVAPGGRSPVRYHVVDTVAPFASLSPGDPRYLALAVQADPRLVAAGEDHRTPGAHHTFGARLRELEVRTEDFLPLAMDARHDDRAARSLLKMTRRRS